MFDYPYIELIFIGLAFTTAGFIVRDELVLRALIFTGTFFDIAFYYLQSPTIWGSVLTNTVVVLVNLLLIVIVIIERSTLFMSDIEKITFEQFSTLNPGQFRKINRLAQWHTATEDRVLLTEGEHTDRLFFIDAETFQVGKNDQIYTAVGPAFAGEIMLLQGGAASATVTIAEGTIYAEWSGEKLRNAMRKSKALENALVARFGHDLADKVRYSVPALAGRKPLSKIENP